MHGLRHREKKQQDNYQYACFLKQILSPLFLLLRTLDDNKDSVVRLMLALNLGLSRRYTLLAFSLEFDSPSPFSIKPFSNRVKRILEQSSTRLASSTFP